MAKSPAIYEGRETFSARLKVAADPAYQLSVHVTSDLAWHILFCQNLFIRESDWWKIKKLTMLNASGLATDPKQDGVNSDAALMLDFTNRRILLCGLRYAGEMKKAMFSVLNFLAPPQDVLMHCAANVGIKAMLPCFLAYRARGKPPCPLILPAF